MKYNCILWSNCSAHVFFWNCSLLLHHLWCEKKWFRTNLFLLILRVLIVKESGERMTDKGSWRGGGGDLSKGIRWINYKILQMSSTSDVRLRGNTFFPEEYCQRWWHFPNICHFLSLAPIHCLERPNWLHCISGCLFGSWLKFYRCTPIIQIGIWLLSWPY